MDIVSRLGIPTYYFPYKETDSSSSCMMTHTPTWAYGFVHAHTSHTMLVLTQLSRFSAFRTEHSVSLNSLRPVKSTILSHHNIPEPTVEIIQNTENLRHEELFNKILWGKSNLIIQVKLLLETKKNCTDWHYPGFYLFLSKSGARYQSGG